MYGPSVPVFVTSFMEGRGRPPAGPLDGGGRRSVYLSVRRNFLSPMMLAFDMPLPATSVGRRNVSNVPAQALILMNDPFVIAQSKVWGAAIAAQSELASSQRVTAMYVQAFGREPSEVEVDAALEFLSSQTRGYGLQDDSLGDERPWSDLGHVLFNVREFIFLK